MTMLVSTPLRDLAAWSDMLSRVEIPVLPETATELAVLDADQDSADAQGIAAIVMRDPLMSVKLYRHLASLRRRTQLTDVESLTGSILMLGLSPFFRAFGALRPISPPAGHTQRWQRGLTSVLSRSQRAADYAFEWAVRRNDLDAELIYSATLLHDFTEVLLWCVAPALAGAVQKELAQNPGLRSIEAQRKILNVGVNELQQALMQRWRLPELLVRITDDHAASDPQVRTVTLAIALARHSADGWDNPALPDDYAALGKLLNLPVQQARLLVAEEPSSV